nr:MAG TPA: tail protein [Caudoviricetes sp.]
MYRIYADETLIYDSTLDDYIITKGQITKEVNKSGSFVFTIYQDHPYYDKLQKLKTIITVYKNEKIVFRGRILNDSIGFFKAKTFTCEGELSFLLDSIQRPYTFTGSPEKLFIQFISNHNSSIDEVKNFGIGEITVKDDNDYINRSNSSYDNTLTNIKDHLVKTHEGYLHITRGDNQKPILNWFADFPYMSQQNINFGENLLDFVKTNSAENIATAIIPLGAKIKSESEEKTEEAEEKRLTIESVNGGIDYIYDPVAVAKYGWIFKVETWDDVTEPANLLRKGQASLNNIIKQNTTIEVKAIDLALMDRSIDSFELGDYINIISEPHGLNDKLLLKKQTLDLLKPDNDKITLGYTYSTFTDKSLSSNTQNDTIIKRVETIENSYAINTVIASELETMRSLITQTGESISSEVSGNYVTNDKLVSEISTVFEQLNDSFEFMFKTLETTVNENDSEFREQFLMISKYIRFIDGNIVLGTSENKIVLKIENNKICFYDNDNLVSYFKDRKLYVEDGEFLGSLKIGKFAFIPRDNGNLSFTKVVK